MQEYLNEIDGKINLEDINDDLIDPQNDDEISQSEINKA